MHNPVKCVGNFTSQFFGAVAQLASRHPSATGGVVTAVALAAIAAVIHYRSAIWHAAQAAGAQIRDNAIATKNFVCEHKGKFGLAACALVAIAVGGYLYKNRA